MSDGTPAYMAPDHDGNATAAMLSDACIVCAAESPAEHAPWCRTTSVLVVERALVGLPTYPPRRPNRAQFIEHEGGWLFVPSEGAER